MNKQILCHVCDSKMEIIEEETLAGWGGYTVILKGIKCYACPECGERLYSGDDVRIMQEISRCLSGLSDSPDYLNVSEVAKILRVSNQTIYNMIRDNRIKGRKFGREWRFTKEDIDLALNEERHTK